MLPLLWFLLISCFQDWIFITHAIVGSCWRYWRQCYWFYRMKLNYKSSYSQTVINISCVWNLTLHCVSIRIFTASTCVWEGGDCNSSEKIICSLRCVYCSYEVNQEWEDVSWNQDRSHISFDIGIFSHFDQSDVNDQKDRKNGKAFSTKNKTWALWYALRARSNMKSWTSHKKDIQNDLVWKREGELVLVQV